MLLYSYPGGADPFSSRRFGDTDGTYRTMHDAAFFANWQVQSNAHALLINEAGRLIYFGAAIEYALNAYTKTYFGASIEYTLGGIVPFSISELLDAATSFGLASEIGLSFSSTFDGTTAHALSKLVDMALDSTGDLTGAFTLNYEISLAIAEVLEGISGFGAQAGPVVAGQAFGFGGHDATHIWVFNAKTFAPSRYDGLDVQSLAKLGTAVYGAGPGGIYEFAGDDDAGNHIQASFIVGRKGFETPNVKRISIGYVHGTSEGILQVRVIDDQGKVYTYETERPLGDTVRSVRFKVGKGLTMHHHQFEVRNKDGGKFEIHHIDVLPEVLTRRVKS